MLNWSLFFLVIAMLAALLGFGGFVGEETLAKILFFVFIGIAIIMFRVGARMNEKNDKP